MSTVLSMLASICVAALVSEPTTPLVPPPPDPRELELHWRAPDGCPTQVDLERRILALLPGEPSGEGVLVVEGDVAVTSTGATLVLRSTFQGRTESRTIESPTCAELGESTAVLIAIALEPSATPLTSLEPAPVPERPPEPTVEPASPATADPVLPPLTLEPASGTTTTASRRRPPVALGLRIAAGIEAGALPPPSGAVAGAASVLWGRARLELHGLWLAPRTAREADGRGATYQLGSAGVRGCGRVFVRSIELPLCAGGEAGALRVRPRSIDTPVMHAPWAAAIASVGLARAWGPVAVVATIDGVARFVGNRFFVGESLSLRQFPLSVRLLLGVELRLGGRRRFGP